MSGNTKRNIVVATMAVLVCAAVGLNWKYSTQEALQQAEETGTKILGEATLVSGQEGTELAEDTIYEGDDYFASARLTRQQARDSAISLLEDAAKQEDAGITAQVRDNGADSGKNPSAAQRTLIAPPNLF